MLDLKYASNQIGCGLAADVFASAPKAHIGLGGRVSHGGGGRGGPTLCYIHQKFYGVLPPSAKAL